MWTYRQTSGELLKGEEHFAFGYSGAQPDGYNNPAFCNVHNCGPIPAGRWTIMGPPFDSPQHGPYCLRLEPSQFTQTYGRDGFLIHGDSIERSSCLDSAHARGE